MAIKGKDMFLRSEGQQLDFSGGSLDTTDIFNTTIAPTINQLLTDTGAEDPILADIKDNAEQARQNGQQSRERILQTQTQSESPNFGFETTTPPVNVPNIPSDDFSQNFEQDFSSSDDDNENSSVSSNNDSFDPASFTFNREARKDSKGRLSVYNPPSGDGGGAFEVAGITARYQKKEATRLRSLIQQGKHKQAEREAKAFFRKRASPFTKHASQKGLQLQLADTVHHRGEGGLRRVLQRATGSSSKSYSTLIKKLDSDSRALAKFNKARVDYELQEIDRGRASRKKFRQGLLNRFKAANKAALQANA